jgi:membrane-bound serine protease (ClpP class)
VTRTISAGLVGKSARPVLTPADRGQWTLVEYVSDGRGILTLNDAQLLRYALASPGTASGGTVSTDEDLKAFFQAKRLVRLDQSVAETIAGWLSGTLVRAVLVVMVLVGVFLEFAAPGFIIGSVLAMVGILGLAGPMIIFGLAGWWWALSVVAGAVLIAVEIFLLPGFGVFGLAGLLALFGGLVGLVAPRSVAFDAAGETSGVLTALATVLVATLVAGVIVYFVARNFSTIPLLGRLVLGPGEPAAPPQQPGDAAGAMEAGAVLRVGAEGVVVTALRPSGKARFGDELVDVVSAGGLVPPGAGVRVVEVSAFRVSVEAVSRM